MTSPDHDAISLQDSADFQSRRQQAINTMVGLRMWRRADRLNPDLSRTAVEQARIDGIIEGYQSAVTEIFGDDVTATINSKIARLTATYIPR